MKKDLIKLTERLIGAALMGGICFAVFTVFTRQSVVATNPLAAAVLTGICAVMPLAVLLGFGGGGDDEGGRP